MHRRPIALLYLLLLLLLAAPAAAQDADARRAKEHFQQGSKFYAGDRYEEALAEFRQGNSLFPHPMFRYNMALCQWRLGDLEEAVEQALMARDPLIGEGDEKAHALNESRLFAFRTVLTAREVAHAPPEDTAGQAPEPELVTETFQRPQPASSTSPLAYVGGGLVVAGAGLAATGAVMGDSITPTIEGYEAAAAEGDEATWSALREDILARQTTARILFFSGVGAAGAGGALVLWGLLSSDSDVALSPTHRGIQATVVF